MFCSALSIAVSSPIWLDWDSPGTLIALFPGLLSFIQIPLPHLALALPLLVHDPSV